MEKTQTVASARSRVRFRRGKHFKNSTDVRAKKPNNTSVPLFFFLRSYNTGVILMDLRKLRSIGWNGLWRSVAVKTLVTHYWTSLADQDIFNTIIKERPELLYPMPCQWNVQLSDNTRSELCYAEVVELKVRWLCGESIGV